MRRLLFISIVLLMAGAIGLQAQEHVERPDSLVRKPEPRANPFPMLGYYGYSSIGRYFFLPLDPGEFETKEDRAARINAETYRRVMESVNYNLSWTRPPHLTRAQSIALFVAQLFLSNPGKRPDGTVPVMSSVPFSYIYTPGWAPRENPYSPDVFPQCIRLEYDSKSGTYKQVMVDWNDFQKNLNRGIGNPNFNAPVPVKRFTTAEKMVD